MTQVRRILRLTVGQEVSEKVWRWYFFNDATWSKRFLQTGTKPIVGDFKSKNDLMNFGQSAINIAMI